jgi:hypothetical protein
MAYNSYSEYEIISMFRNGSSKDVETLLRTMPRARRKDYLWCWVLYRNSNVSVGKMIINSFKTITDAVYSTAIFLVKIYQQSALSFYTQISTFFQEISKRHYYMFTQAYFQMTKANR